MFVAFPARLLGSPSFKPGDNDNLASCWQVLAAPPLPRNNIQQNFSIPDHEATIVVRKRSVCVRPRIEPATLSKMLRFINTKIPPASANVSSLE